MQWNLRSLLKLIITVKRWKAQEGLRGSIIYGWLAREDDYKSEGPVGEYLRKAGELKTISNLVQEATQDRNKIVANLANEIDIKNENLNELQYKYNEKTMSLSRMLEEKDMLHHAFYEDEQEMLNYELENKRKELDTWSKQLNKREALTERERQKLDEEKQENSTRNNSLQMASMEQKKADENVLRLVEEQKKEKQEALNKILRLERQLDAKQKLEMEIEELKGKLQDGAKQMLSVDKWDTDLQQIDSRACQGPARVSDLATSQTQKQLTGGDG
ncbi:Factor of DNA methylation 2 [Camellia lanceoleosa]|uniref:Factor of DNA methylation 2 n=1 Tax=Camellia lanceoleosa TaxID=1840588 RepID=A0ACC0F909_9ERIC|nr:Factor of DNA methylation 2 [Camellia lanceoleosa]